MNTETLLIFGSYSSMMCASVCAEAVEKIGRYLLHIYIIFNYFSSVQVNT